MQLGIFFKTSKGNSIFLGIPDILLQQAFHAVTQDIENWNKMEKTRAYMRYSTKNCATAARGA